MSNIFEELAELYRRINAFPEKAHWFCPKRDDDDQCNYNAPDQDEDEASSATKKTYIVEGRARLNTAYRFAVVFGLSSDEENAQEWQDSYISRLTTLLTSCDRCVRNYHMRRKEFLKRLSEEFDEDLVAELARRIESNDFDRIDKGLQRAINTLNCIPDEKKSVGSLAAADLVGLTGLYEALCCAPYHKSAEKLEYPLGEVMRLVQTGKRLRLNDLVPSTTSFLFDPDHYRNMFAVVGWTKFNENLDAETFDWVVHDALSDAIQVAGAPNSDPAIVQRFWEGLLLVLQKLDHDGITHSLRGIEVQPDIYHLALTHLSYASVKILEAIIQVINVLLTKGPKAFWSALGTISPATVAEQLFNSPAFGRLLARPKEEDSSATAGIQMAAAWVVPFITSLPAAHQYEACRAIVFNLLERFQQDQVQEESRVILCSAALDALKITLAKFASRDYEINPSTSFILINDILKLVCKFQDIIVGYAVLPADTYMNSQLSERGLLVLRYSLALDCKALSFEFRALQSNTPVDHGLENRSDTIWRTILESFRPDSVDLAKTFLSGIASLIGLETFKAKVTRERGKPAITHPLPTDRASFNHNFGQLTEIIATLFERLSDFSPRDLKLLCQSPVTARPLFGALISADISTNQAAVEVIKTITGEDRRKEAIAKLVDMFLETTLTSLTFSAKQINTYRTFTAVPYLLKIGQDVLNSLCDSQEGILRTRTSLSHGEQVAISSWWVQQWHAIEGAFSMTEEWSSTYSNDVMTNFCRDTMEYAEALFDQYNLLASALKSDGRGGLPSGATASELLNDSRKRILEQPRAAAATLVKWLRLKDPYLASTVVSLLSKLLRRLGEFDMDIGESSSKYIALVATTSSLGKKEQDREKKRFGVSTILTEQEKAELLRALDDHRGIEIAEPFESTVTKERKQGTIEAWSRSANGARHEPRTSSKSHARQGVIDVDSWQTKSRSDLSDDLRTLSRTVDQKSSTLDAFRARENARNAAAAAARTPLMHGGKPGETLGQARAREKEETRRKAAAFVQSQRKQNIVPGEGSGLKGLGGVQGKDHAPPKGEMMVSSSDESSDDENDAKALIRKSREGARKGADLEDNRKRALKLQQPQGPVRKTKIIRSAKDMRARLIPPMEILHHAILRWEIFHQGDEAPDNIDCIEVANTFQTPNAYAETFYPLLISEAWRSFSTAKDENNSRPFEVKIVNRMSVDQFYEVSTSMSLALGKEVSMMEGDIILLSKGQDPMREQQAPHCLGRIARITRKKDLMEISYRVSSSAVNNSGLLASLAPNVTIHGYKITSMTTIEREYAALKSLQYYDLCDEILHAKPSPLLPYSSHVLEPIRHNYGVNIGQAKAIWSAKENDAFTLIQGPPGSGKTKTIVAMVGALLTDSFGVAGVAIDRPNALRNAEAPAKAPLKKLLVCAPSNAAVDELVTRLKEGVKTLKGEFHKINVIRLGRSDAINSNVKDVTLDELVRAKLEGDGTSGKTMVSKREKMHLDAGLLKEQLAALRPQLDEARSKGDKTLELRLQREFDGRKRDQARIGALIDADKDSGNTAARDNEINRRRVQQEIINGAHVLCATLSGSGHEMFKNLSVEFETVIIDEAAQSIELSALIPLKYGCSKCILVGDPKQLPPTVLSRSAARYGYEQSLFVRMQKNHPESIHLLDTQYRMHPEISRFPSTQFYDGKLVDGPDMAKLRTKPWHKSPLLAPYRFFDVKGVQTSAVKGHSFINSEEIRAAMQLYERLCTDYKSYDFKGKIGIITPYKAQLRELRRVFSGRYGEAILDDIDFNTTDAFQGRESEIIIFSCVRARASGGIGFLDDIRRMNVGLTRAKSSLWVLGNSQSLLQGEFWAKLVIDAQSRGAYVDGDIMTLLRKPSPEVRVSSSLALAESSDITMENTPIELHGRASLGAVASRPKNSPHQVVRETTKVIGTGGVAPKPESKKREREVSPSDGKIINKKPVTQTTAVKLNSTAMPVSAPKQKFVAPDYVNAKVPNTSQSQHNLSSNNNISGSKSCERPGTPASGESVQPILIKKDEHATNNGEGSSNIQKRPMPAGGVPSQKPFIKRRPPPDPLRRNLGPNNRHK